MANGNMHNLGYRWRSSRWFTVSCIAMALFSANFLHSYIVPILQVMLEDRLHVEKSQTQSVTSLVLSIHALVSMLFGPWIGYMADKLPNRKCSLLMSLGAEMFGTIVIMIAPSVNILLVGRAIQAIGGNAAWIVGLATLSETVGEEYIGTTLGAMSSFFTSGFLFGPMASGILLPFVGYRITWMVAIAVLGVDMMMRVIMIENKQSRDVSNERTTLVQKLPNDIEAAQANDSNEVTEQTALLRRSSSEHVDQNCEPQSNVTRALLKSNSVPELASPSENLYKFLLTNSRALAALVCHCTMGIILLSLDTTLPLHAASTFGWDTAQVSLMFLLLQLPSLLLATFLGLLKDRVGTRIPAALGFLAMACSLWLLGAAANDGVAFGNAGHRGQTISMVSLFSIGIARALISGTGIMEITNVMKDVQKEQPNRFGPNSKMSSAYSLTNFAWNTGMLIGPIISGFLTRSVGYYYMNMVIAIMSCIVGIVALTFLGK